MSKRQRIESPDKGNEIVLFFIGLLSSDVFKFRRGPIVNRHKCSSNVPPDKSIRDDSWGDDLNFGGGL